MAHFNNISDLYHITSSDLALHSNPINKNGVWDEKSRKFLIYIPNSFIVQMIWHVTLNISLNTDDVF
jgi:hypothetical protein